MNDEAKKRPDAGFARPLAFTFLAAYGLLTFLVGYQDWQVRQQLATWASWTLIISGILLGSAAIRVIRRRSPALGISAIPLIALLVIEAFTNLTPGTPDSWKPLAMRIALAAVILLLVRRVDHALPDQSAKKSD